MTHTRTTFAATLVGAALVGLSVLPSRRPELIWNASASVPIGLYRVTPARTLAVNDIVVVRPPPALAGFLSRGGYLPRGVPLLKHVAGLAGARVCRNGSHVVIAGQAVAEARSRDRRGRPLPRWQGCLTLAADQIFLLNVDRPDSLDGRYFGPLDRSTVVGRAVPLWTERDPS